uniref:(northern house mosquito) hypothetical protein n=1 Tax=Culex pipiens TaxID=7175 RepID=A0A8D8HEX1_CULPI
MRFGFGSFASGILGTSPARNYGNLQHYPLGFGSWIFCQHPSHPRQHLYYQESIVVVVGIFFFVGCYDLLRFLRAFALFYLRRTNFFRGKFFTEFFNLQPFAIAVFSGLTATTVRWDSPNLRQSYLRRTDDLQPEMTTARFAHIVDTFRQLSLQDLLSEDHRW